MSQDPTKKPEDRGALQDADAARGHASTRPTCTTARSPRCARWWSSTTRAAIPNPNLSRPKIKPLGLTDEEVDALVAFMQSLDGEGYQDTPPTSFPQ